MLINEKHLSMIDPQAKKYLNEQREKFLDNGDYEKPAGYKPLKSLIPMIGDNHKAIIDRGTSTKIIRR